MFFKLNDEIRNFYVHKNEERVFRRILFYFEDNLKGKIEDD